MQPDPMPVDAGPVELSYVVNVEATSQEGIDRICAWMRANGADPELIPEGSAITVKGTELTFIEITGRDMFVNGQYPTRVRTVPLLVAPLPSELFKARNATVDYWETRADLDRVDPGWSEHHTLASKVRELWADLLGAQARLDRLDATPPTTLRARSCPTCHSIGTRRDGCQDLWHIEVRPTTHDHEGATG